MKAPRRKPRSSVRTILVAWFLIFSVVPLGFVTWYSLSKFEKAIDRELSQRLSGNAREISGILADYMSGLQSKRDRYVKDPLLIYDLANSDAGSLRSVGTNWLRQDFASGLSFFSRDGRLITGVSKGAGGEVRSFVPTQNAVFLSDRTLSLLKGKTETGLAEFTEGKMSLLLISRVKNSANRVSGYLEQSIDIDKAFLQRLKARLKLELLIFRDNGDLVLGSHPDFTLYRKDSFKTFFRSNSDSFFDLNVRGVPYGFLVSPLDWDQTPFSIALGASKGDAREVLKNINFAFITVIGAVILLIMVATFAASSWLLKPLYELVQALQSFEAEEQAVTIPVKDHTEIGLLTQSFNDMSLKIWKARSDLQKKITELESTNLELRETQTKLVHSAKMVSLGQLVAGVAHELNNPISFIYSNMIHLKDYAGRLMHLVDVAEKDPRELPAAKVEAEFDYVVKDLPKLINSCEEGARRTRDIVLGLRNFSRLEEAKLIEVDLRVSLETTLNLLQGEIKNRIQVHQNYEPIPLVNCYASQINQVFMNILSNALQAIEGPGQIWIATHVVHDSKKGPVSVQVSIQDSGKGMAPDVLEKIFDPFFTTKGVGQGTGLGLSITYGIVHNHGGELLVKSEEGVGTEFSIILPVQPPADPNAVG